MPQISPPAGHGGKTKLDAAHAASRQHLGQHLPPTADSATAAHAPPLEVGRAVPSPPP